MQRRRALYAFLIILALVLVGTVVVLSSVTYYLAIDPSAYLSEDEVPYLSNNTRWNASDHGQLERVPRIIHQTWKTDTLPLNWQNVSQGCRDMMPDYEYMLWSDAASRDFIKRHYPWFLDTFDSYPYNIQRADVIRYFVLHYYGGVYLDLDVGCLRPVDLLLIYPVVLPETIPVGISNDLMFAEKGHPFMAQTIHNLVTFDHNYILNYPTVMFTTGPMFLSAQLSIFTSSHSNDNGIRVLPKSLYGKNAKEGEAPHSFFLHYYGSSWHADDAAFIGFLNHWGKLLMYIGGLVLLGGIIRTCWPSQQKRTLVRIAGYDVVLPRSPRWQILGSWAPLSTSIPPSPDPDADVPLLPSSLVRAASPTSEGPAFAESYLSRHGITGFVQRLRGRVARFAGAREDGDTVSHPRRRYNRGVLFFLPAIFAVGQDIELRRTRHDTLPLHGSRATSRVPAPEKNPNTFREHERDALRDDGPSGWNSSTDDAGETTTLVDIDDEPSTPRRCARSSPSSSRSASRGRLA